MGGADGTAGRAGHDPGEAGHRSRWPAVTAAGAGTLYVGAGLAFVGYATGYVPPSAGLALAAVGTLSLVAGLAGWVEEAFLAGDARTRPARTPTYRATTWLFVATDVATFGAVFVYYFFVRAGPWPPEPLPDLLGSLVLVNTLVLVASSATLHLGHRALDAGRRRRFLGWLGLTVGLGAVFLAGQALEYYEFVVGEGFGPADGVFASAFFGLTGLHGLHVALGVVLLSVLLGRALVGHYAPGRDTSVATVSIYWHFVDAVWLALVAVLYVGATL